MSLEFCVTTVAISAVRRSPHLGLLESLQLVGASRTRHREVRAVQGKKLEPTVDRVVIPEAQHLLLLTERLVPLEHDSRGVGLKQRLVQPYRARDRRGVVLQVQELHDARCGAGVRSESSAATAAASDFKNQIGRSDLRVLLVLRLIRDV